MTYGQVFDLAAAYISEDADAVDFSELARRLPPLVKSVVSELIPLDKILTEDSGKTYNNDWESIDAEDDFPLCCQCASLCAIRLGILLIADENPALAGFLNTEYVRVRQEAIRSVRATLEDITDVYSD